MHRITLLRTATLLSLPLVASVVQAQSTPANCLGLSSDAQRLACYDQLHGRVSGTAVSPAMPLAPGVSPQQATPGPMTQPLTTTVKAPTSPEAPPVTATLLAKRWDLDGSVGELYAPRTYRPMYILPFTWTSQTNQRPQSPAPDHSTPSDLNVRPVEAKFQISLKSKLAVDVFGSDVSIWGGYTQSSRWQIYSGQISRPFRETNYEPELMAVLPLHAEFGGWGLRMAGLSLNHQSNGRSLPLSRSWNRLIGALVLERGEWIAELRPWARIGESDQEDDNPGIENYMGRGELRLSRYWGSHALTVQLRHSLRGGDKSHGSGQVEWAFPISGSLHGYLQMFSGYGESMIDYNLRQNKLGLGVTLADWR
jgi:phospholipase A1